MIGIISYHFIQSMTPLNALAAICEIIQFNGDDLTQPWDDVIGTFDTDFGPRCNLVT